MKIYLDNNATTALYPEVRDTIIETLSCFGNPSSSHSFGREAKALLMNSRDKVASYFGCKSQEIIFTSSGTEALNMVIKGFCALQGKGHIITSSVEHAAVYTTLQAMEAQGWKVTYLNPGLYGAVTREQVEQALQPDTKLIALMAANNETGAITDIQSLGALAQLRNIPFIVDGVGILGKEEFTIPAGVLAMCFAGHKIHGPKGVGIAVVKKQFKFQPLITGGHQEFERRGGTEDVLAIAGIAKAFEVLQRDGKAAIEHMRCLRDRFEAKLLALPGVSLNGSGPRVSNTSNLRFEGVEGEMLLMKLDMAGIAASHGSACSTGALEPSRILLNMGLTRKQASESLRFSLSRFTTEEEIDQAVYAIQNAVTNLCC